MLMGVEKNKRKKLSTLSTGVFIIVFYLIIKKSIKIITTNNCGLNCGLGRIWI